MWVLWIVSYYISCKFVLGDHREDVSIDLYPEIRVGRESQVIFMYSFKLTENQGSDDFLKLHMKKAKSIISLSNWLIIIHYILGGFQILNCSMRKHKSMLHWSLSGGQDVDVQSSSATENLHASCCDSLQCSFNLVDKASCRKLCQICPARRGFSSKASKWRITLFHWTIPNRHKQGQTEQQRV